MDINFFDLDSWKNITVILGVIFSTFSIFRGVLEYSKQGTQARAKHYFELQRRFKENKTFVEICFLCENNDPAIKNIPCEDRFMLLIFYEELAILMNSKLIKKNLVHYMYGFYIIKCWKCNYFWHDIDKNSPYWGLFCDLATQMEELENNKLKYNQLKL